ncbi:MAG: hypothetical protein IKS37_06090 [Solobacterium sp.]|nr:hypothetical protein [Solobacterium sp.]
MRKVICTLAAAILLVGCAQPPSSASSKEPDLTPLPTVQPAITPTPDAEIPPQPVEPASVFQPVRAYAEEEWLRQYRDAMSDSMADIAYLGTTAESSLDAVIKRAEDIAEFRFLQENGNERTFYGERSRNGESVYLIIPGRGVRVSIWDRSGTGADQEDIYYHAVDDGPFLFVEEDDHMEAPSYLLFERSDTEYVSLFSGFDAIHGQLRANQQEGIHDVTPYSLFPDSTGRRYDDLCQKALQQDYRVKPFLEAGAEIVIKEEAIIDDDVCIVFILKQNDKEAAFFAVHYDDEDQEADICQSEDGIRWPAD